MKKYFWWIIGAGVLLLVAGGGLWYWHTAPDRELAFYMYLERRVGWIASEQGAAAAVDFLRQELRKNPGIENFCHPLAHEIGRASFEKEGFEKALHFEYDICGSGYIHGVVEQYMKGIPNLIAALPTICPPNAPKCFHGIGHGLMLRSDNDLPASLDACHTFGQKWQQVQCAEGVFMENFEADLVGHTTNYLKPEDPFFPCRGRSLVDEGVCAFYVPRYFIESRGPDYAGAIEYCNHIPEGPRDACFKGIGDTAMKHHIADLPFSIDLCLHVPQEQRRFCVEGMTSYFIVHYASAKKGNELCALLDKHDLPACQKVIAESMAAYPN